MYDSESSASSIVAKLIELFYWVPSLLRMEVSIFCREFAMLDN